MFNPQKINFQPQNNLISTPNKLVFDPIAHAHQLMTHISISSDPPQLQQRLQPQIQQNSQLQQQLQTQIQPLPRIQQ